MWTSPDSTSKVGVAQEPSPCWTQRYEGVVASGVNRRAAIGLQELMEPTLQVWNFGFT